METDKLVGKGAQTSGGAGSDAMDGSKERDYHQSFALLIEMVDKTLDDYKSDLQQILFPVFSVLYLTLIRRGFIKGARHFFNQYSPNFKSKNSAHNQDLDTLESVKSQNDLQSSLEVDKYLKNKFFLKLSLHSKEILI